MVMIKKFEPLRSRRTQREEDYKVNIFCHSHVLCSALTDALSNAFVCEVELRNKRVFPRKTWEQVDNTLFLYCYSIISTISGLTPNRFATSLINSSAEWYSVLSISSW